MPTPKGYPNRACVIPVTKPGAPAPGTDLLRSPGGGWPGGADPGTGWGFGGGAGQQAAYALAGACWFFVSTPTTCGMGFRIASTIRDHAPAQPWDRMRVKVMAGDVMVAMGDPYLIAGLAGEAQLLPDFGLLPPQEAMACPVGPFTAKLVACDAAGDEPANNPILATAVLEEIPPPDPPPTGPTYAINGMITVFNGMIGNGQTIEIGLYVGQITATGHTDQPGKEYYLEVIHGADTMGIVLPRRASLAEIQCDTQTKWTTPVSWPEPWEIRLMVCDLGGANPVQIAREPSVVVYY